MLGNDVSGTKLDLSFVIEKIVGHSFPGACLRPNKQPPNYVRRGHFGWHCALRDIDFFFLKMAGSILEAIAKLHTLHSALFQIRVWNESNRISFTK